MRKVNLQNIINKNSEDKLNKYSKKVSSTLPDDSWLSQYKRGGGYFSEYHSWAPPRHANGGDISIPDLERTNKFLQFKQGGTTMLKKFIPKYDKGGCPPGTIPYGDGSGNIRCIPIDSDEYKQLYNSGKLGKITTDDKGVATYWNWDAAANKWVDRRNLPEVIIGNNLTKEQKEKYINARNKRRAEEQKRINDEIYALKFGEGSRPIVDNTVLPYQNLKNKRMFENEEKRKDVWIKERQVYPKIDRWGNGVDYTGYTKEQLEQAYQFEKESKELERQYERDPSSRPKVATISAAGPEKTNWIRDWNENYGTDYRKRETWRKEREETNENERDKAAAWNAANKGAPYTFPTGETKSWDQMTGNEKDYVRGRSYQGWFDPTVGVQLDGSWTDAGVELLRGINVFPTLGDWYGGFAKANYIGEKSGNNVGSYAKSWGKAILDPALTIAAYAALNPELNPTTLMRTKVLNPLSDFQKFGKLYTAAETGNVVPFLADEILRKKSVKDFAKAVTPGEGTIVKTEGDAIDYNNQPLTLNTNKPPASSQTSSFSLASPSVANNTTSSGGFKINPKLLTIPSFLKNKHGGSTNWLDKYKHI